MKGLSGESVIILHNFFFSFHLGTSLFLFLHLSSAIVCFSDRSSSWKPGFRLPPLYHHAADALVVVDGGKVWHGDGVMLFSSAAFHLPFQVCPEPFCQLSTSLFSRNTAMVFNVYIRSGRKMTENEQVDKMLKHFWVAWGQSGTALIPSHWLCSLKIPASCLISHRKEGSFISHFLPEYHLMMLLQYREGSVHTTWRTGRLLRESFHPKALSFVILTQAREGYCQQSLDI